jgi:hypothetical protein
MSRTVALIACFSLVVPAQLALGGCEPKKPARLSMDPSGPFKMDRKGQSREVRVAPYDDKNRPYTTPIDVTWSSSDDSVATVAEGKITSTGSGTATITASSGDIKVETSVTVSVPAVVEIAPLEKTTFRLRGGKGKGGQVKVVVKDDKGTVMEKPPRIDFTVSNWCIDINPDGTFKPVSLGKCKAIATVAGISAKVEIEVVP